MTDNGSTPVRLAYSVAETAEMLGIGESTLHQQIRRGEFPAAVRFGGRVVVPAAQLRRILGESSGDMSSEYRRGWDDALRTIMGRVVEVASNPPAGGGPADD